MPVATSFGGLQRGDLSSQNPPNVVGDVGPSYYLQAVTEGFQLFEKAGVTAAPAMTFDDLWTGASSPQTTACTGLDSGTNHSGGGAVLYDHLDDRWLIVDTAWIDPDSGPYYICVAVSSSGDPKIDPDGPVGPWFRYALSPPQSIFQFKNVRLGLWSDAIYMSTDLFAPDSSTPAGVRFWALNRSNLAAGDPLYYVSTQMLGSGLNSLLPANLRGSLPPAGTPGYFAALDLTADPDDIDVWKFNVDWPANPQDDPTGSVTGPKHVAIDALPCRAPHRSFRR
jgi:hypothetical protein